MANEKISRILSKRERGEKITMVTAYDYPLAKIADDAGVDVVLVGDSLANVVLGLESTRQVGMAEMIHHARAARRGVKNALLVGDMPYESYQEHPQQAVGNARRFVEEAGCDAVKLEWFDQCVEVARHIIAAGIPVMGHVGLTPQTAEQLGGFKVQGKDAQSARNIMENAKALEQAGCFSLVIECVPAPIAEKITQSLGILTIGIGAGPNCGGQVLVIHDLLGLFDRYRPKFVKPYADLGAAAKRAVEEYCREVREGTFPDKAHSFDINPDELEKLS